MDIIYAQQQPDFSKESIFLAGPTKRKGAIETPGSHWRQEALSLLTQLNFQGTVFVPEFQGSQAQFDYLSQVEWEYTCLENCDVIVFWVPRKINGLPGFTTNVEFGRYIDNPRSIYGRPKDSEQTAYLDWLYKKVRKKTPFETLKDTLQQATTLCKKDPPMNLPEMEDWFTLRTRKHIALVQKWAKFIEYVDPQFAGLYNRTLVHDQSKFEEPEHTPYIYITWDYKCKADKIPYTMPADMKEKGNEATYHHVKNNTHHPEFFDPTTTLEETLNQGNRDGLPTKMVNATAMAPMDIAEMCADWLAVSEERGTKARDWANNNVNKRWKFNDDQVALIYRLIGKTEN